MNDKEERIYVSRILDKCGRITIPAQYRRLLGIDIGDEVSFVIIKKGKETYLQLRKVEK